MGLSARRSGSILRAWVSIPGRNLRAAGFARAVGWGRIRVLGRRWVVVVQRVVEVIAVGDVVGRRVLGVAPGGAGGFEQGAGVRIAFEVWCNGSESNVLASQLPSQLHFVKLRLIPFFNIADTLALSPCSGAVVQNVKRETFEIGASLGSWPRCSDQTAPASRDHHHSS